MHTSSSGRSGPFPLVLLASWTAFGVLALAWLLASNDWGDGTLAPVSPLLAGALSAVWIAALLTPAVLFLTWNADFTPTHRLESVAAHLVAGGLFVGGSALLEQAWRERVSYGVETRLLAYVAIVASAQAVRYFQMYRKQQLETGELAVQLADARLQFLKMQLQPHFLFNTLNTVAELVHTDADAADLMIRRLARLLRLTLDRSGHELVPLRQELHFLRTYLAIEKVRFQGGLEVIVDCSPDALDAAVPTLLWQPAVENAIRHGVRPLGTGGRIVIMAHKAEDDLVLEIRDNGYGLPAAEAGMREGIGLRNIRERIAQFYGDRGAFTLRNASGGGATALFRIPYTRGTTARRLARLAPGGEPVEERV